MDSPLIQAVIVASGGSLSFGVILIVVLILSRPRGVPRAWAFLAGHCGAYFLVGLLVLALGEPPIEGVPSVRIVARLVIGGVMLVAGLVLWSGAVPDDDDGPAWLGRLDRMSARGTALFGAVVAIVNFKNLALFVSAVLVLSDAGVVLPQAAGAIAIVVIVFCSTVILPVPVSAAYPKRSKPVLQRSRLWIERHDRTLLIFVLVLFGLVFCIRGVWPLL